MEYKFKYRNKPKPNPKKIRTIDPATWITGPDPLRHEKYYAYLKHKAQCKFRQNDYDLSWEEWESLWEDDLFLNRGRGIDNLCLSRTDPSLPWSFDNVQITTRGEHLKRNGEFRNGGTVV